MLAYIPGARTLPRPPRSFPVLSQGFLLHFHHGAPPPLRYLLSRPPSPTIPLAPPHFFYVNQTGYTPAMATPDEARLHGLEQRTQDIEGALAVFLENKKQTLGAQRAAHKADTLENKGVWLAAPIWCSMCTAPAV